MTPMKNLTLTFLLMTAAALPAAELKTTPLMPDGKARPYRANVLMVGPNVKAQEAAKLQEEMEDALTLHRLEHQVSSVDEWLKLLKTKEGKKLRDRPWHLLCLTLPELPEGSLQKITTAWKGDVVWVPESGAQVEPAMKAKITEGLLKNSTPSAELPAGEKRNPANLLQDEALLKDPNTLPLVSAKTATIFKAEEGQWQFNLHSYIAHHDGKFWAIWSSGRVDEDSSNQFIRYATSKDGETWSESGVVAGDPDGEEGPQRWLASGLYVEEGKLYALGCLNLGNQKDGRIWAGAKLVRLQWTADGWKDQGVFADNCMVYFPPMKVAGRDFFVWRDELAHFFTARSLPGQGKWEVKKHPNFPPDYRMSETATYEDADGVLHMIIRDQGKTKRLYHSLSYDQGGSWTLPVKTNYPDAVSKNMAGRLSNGLFYLINNPQTTGLRDPLTISFSRDGWTFGSPKNLRVNAPERRYPGGAKNNFSFQYSHAIEHEGRLWVIYATNKEDIEVSSYDLKELVTGE